MNFMSRAGTALLLISLIPCAAVAEDKLSCQADLRLPDCSTPGAVWTSSGPLHVGVTCQVCSVKGSEVSCSPEEKATAAGLSIETPLAKVVEGTFSEVGGCGIGVKLFQFSGSLTAGESYVLVLNAPPLERTAILNFSVATAVSSGDGGDPVTPGDAGSSGDRSGLSAEAGAPPSPGTEATGQQGDGGCGCHTAAGSPLSLGVLALLLLPTGVIRRRRSHRR